MIEFEKTTKLRGRIMVKDVLVKEIIAEIDKDGVSTTYETIYDAELLRKNRKEVRADDKAFTAKKEAIEDESVVEGAEVGA